MAIPRIPADAAELKGLHENLLTELEGLSQAGAQKQRRIRLAADQMAGQALEGLMKAVPVENLSREKRGLRVTTLKNNGIFTLLDLYRTPVSQLAAIDGISDQGAVEIRQLAERMAAALQKDVKIRLSLDEKNPFSTELALALWNYRETAALSQRCEGLFRENREKVLRAGEDLKPGFSGFKWLFTSGSKKQQASDAYVYLSREKQEGYYPQGLQTAQALKALLVSSPQQAWAAFAADPVPFFGALEQVCPGLLGDEDDRCGLPEQLARQVQQEEFSLNGLSCQLRRYQQWGVRYILRQKRVLLGDEMGLGKTVQAIAAMVALRNKGQSHFVVVCPAGVIPNWCREIRKHSNLSVSRIHGEDRRQVLQEWLITGGVAVTNYESTGDFLLPEGFPLAMVVVDEAHYIKNPGAQRTRHVKKISDHADRRLFMTGTAMENRVEEMISLISMLQPEAAAQAQRLAALSQAPQFRQAVAPVYYRRKRESVLKELPEKTESEQWCSLGKEEAAVYEAAVLEGRYADARRVSWNAENLRQSCKAARMLEILEKAGQEGRKVIVFSFFLSTLGRVCSLLGSRCYGPIDGSVPVEQRQQIIDRFDKAPPGTVLAAQIQAGGTGLNIQSASVVILCEPQLKPSAENQAISRAYRMGQARNVLVYRLLCEDTVDERITQLLAAKQAQFDAYADESVAAMENLELDSSGLQTIMHREADRIRRKQEAT